MNQILGTFSSSDIDFTITSDGISFTDNSVGVVKEVGELNKNRRRKISQWLIDKANDISDETGTIQCIYDMCEIEFIDHSIDSDNCDDFFYIDSWIGLEGLPSRHTYYDTETRLVNFLDRHFNIRNFLKILNFKPLDINGFEQNEMFFEPKREISYRNLNNSNVIIRVKPNLMIEFSKFDHIGLNKRFTFFYNRNQILSLLNITKEELREIKLKSIL